MDGVGYNAVVAEWLRRLTRNQIPSGSVGSSPTDRVRFSPSLSVAFVYWLCGRFPDRHSLPPSPSHSIRVGSYETDRASLVAELVYSGEVLCCLAPRPKLIVTGGTSTVRGGMAAWGYVS